MATSHLQQQQLQHNNYKFHSSIDDVGRHLVTLRLLLVLLVHLIMMMMMMMMMMMIAGWTVDIGSHCQSTYCFENSNIVVTFMLPSVL